jgi:protein SCO1/2
MNTHSSPSAFAREEAVALGGALAILAVTAAWWALAFWPVHDAPVWLERTRYVCFGVAASGMPDSGGWVGLIGGPAGMAAILVAGWLRGFRRLVRRARASAAFGGALVSVLVGTLLVAGAGVLEVRQAGAAGFDLREEPGPAPTAAEHPRLDTPAPALALLAHDGTTVDVRRLRGRPVLVTFAYAHCATICPLVVRHALEAQAKLANDERRPAVLIVTLDPWRDTPSRLGPMAAAWMLADQDAWVLGGTVENVEAALDAWRVPRTRDARTGEVTHPSLVYVVDRHGRIAFAATGGAETLAGLLRRL